MKKVVTILGLSSLVLSPMAMAEYTVYGKAHLAISAESPDSGSSTTELVSRASRVGIKGSTELTEGLDAIYKWESEVDLTGENGGHLKARNQFIGLKGSFGKIIGGIHDTPMKQAEGKIDLFSDREDMATVLSHTVDVQEREKQLLGYYSPKLGHLHFNIATMPGSGSGGKDNELGDAWSAALIYGDKKLKKSNFYAAIAYDDEVDKGTGLFGKSTNAIRLAAQTKLGQAKIGGIIEQAEEGSADHTRYVISGKYNISHKTALLAQYVAADEFGNFSRNNTSKGVGSSDDFILGIDHKLGKHTTVYAMGGVRDLGDTSTGNGNVADLKNKEQTSYFSVGIMHKFSF